MKKLSLILALMAGLMLPLTAVAKPDSSSKRSKSKRPKTESKTDKGSTKNATTNTGKDQSAESASVSAEPEKKGGKMSDEQIKLNNEAKAAVEKGDFKKAGRLFVALLDLGEFNAVWYQLGNTYAREDRCIEAYDAYSRVASAPILDDEVLTPELILAATQKGIAKLDEQCSAKIVFNCKIERGKNEEASDEIMKLSLDGGDEFECISKPIPAVPGNHSVYARSSFKVDTIAFNTIEKQVNNVDIVLVDDSAWVGGRIEELKSKSTLLKALGYSFLGVGVAAGTTGGVLAYYYWNDYKTNRDPKNNKNSEENSNYNYDDAVKDYNKAIKMRNLGFGLAAGGAAIGVTGIILLIVDAVKIQGELKELESGQQKAFYISPVLSPEFGGLTFTTTF